ncbi:hypothetical protein F7731_02830 [Cytobacillus depressus]|uniref:YqgU-like 6-bladed beta-propeller domain-containing protein n=1 Tax=Cytobacillus depressus TaxID=1602942 RepID=A0A6L3VBE2_9BACI|nr:hypothetical protein [Cytobacillus depressus]KAB2338512.1 hypothetical protein F7731_02830 [Cytobacillus depressus]
MKKEAGVQPIIKYNKAIQKAGIPPSFTTNNVQAPIPIQKGPFNSVNGWLNNETIIYMENVELGSNVYTYNLFSGESRLIFESEFPISSVLPSPSRSQLLIQSSPNSYEGMISILDANGHEILTKRISASEFAYEWNPYNEGKILISAFTENWDYTMYLLNLEGNKLEIIENKEPFAFWLNEEEITYLNWNEKDLSLFAPLVKKSIKKQNEKQILHDVYYIKAIKNVLMTITVNSERSNEAVYTFFSNQLEKLSSMSVPHLTRYSDWLVPYLDFDEHNQFITFQPLFSTAADAYNYEFQLLSYNIISGESKVLMDHLKNEPLSCSPNGKNCLYGYFFEKLINLETQKIIPLVQDF